MAEEILQVLNPARDEFERYYAEKLWEWIPPIYRHEDGLAEQPHVLRALVEILACQSAVARRSADRLWDDEFIHYCDDWAIPYIGALLGTRLVGNLNRRGRRVDVARTLFYRRRKGTPVVMEALIQDITGWEGVVVESFKRLARTRHRLDPEPSGLARPITHTPPGGVADLRAGRISDILDGPFDDLAHTPDFRRLRGFQGRYNIPKLNFHLYRLRVFEVNLATPFDFGDKRFSIDPSGRDIPLFRPGRRGPEVDWTPVEEWQLPASIPCRLFNEEKEHLIPEALAVTIGSMPQDPPLDKTGLHAGYLSNWTLPNALAFAAVVDPHLGRLMLVNPLTGGERFYIPRHHYGFSADLGAGTYDRAASVRTEGVTAFPDGGNDPDPVIGFALPAEGTHSFTNSKTYRPDTPPANRLSNIEDVWIQADDRERPYITLVPGNNEREWIFEAAPKVNDSDVRSLTLEGLWLGLTPGGIPDEVLPDPTSACTPVETVLAIEGIFDRVVIRHCTLDPGGERARLVSNTCTPIPSVALEIRGQVRELVIESSIVGAIREVTDDTDPCSVGRIVIRDSTVQSLLPDTPAISTRVGEVNLERVTVFGDVVVNRLDATEALIRGLVRVLDNQHGCFRFSATDQNPDRRLPRQFESQLFAPTIAGHFFISQRFGDPGFAQLSKTAPESIATGAENDSEMGAFSRLLNPIKRRDLERKVIEFMPFGLIPQFIFET
jgi:hypothetical protein